jgi:hypothetical protein
MIVLMRGLLGQKVKLKDAFRESGLQTSGNRLEKIHELLPESLNPLYDQVNKDMQECIRPCGSASLDETMWPWKGSHPATVFIPRKPHKTGFKVQTIVFRLAYTNLSFAWAFQPELSEKHPGPSECMDWFNDNTKNIPQKELTCDSWYPTFSWMEAHEELPVTAAIHSTSGVGVYDLFTYELKNGEYRLFKKGPLLLCAFADNAHMVTASTRVCLAVSQLDEDVDEEASLDETSGKIPKVTAADITAMSQLRKALLQHLLQLQGKPISRCYIIIIVSMT